MLTDDIKMAWMLLESIRCSKKSAQFVGGLEYEVLAHKERCLGPRRLVSGSRSTQLSGTVLPVNFRSALCSGCSVNLLSLCVALECVFVFLISCCCMSYVVLKHGSLDTRPSVGNHRVRQGDSDM